MAGQESGEWELTSTPSPVMVFSSQTTDIKRYRSISIPPDSAKATSFHAPLAPGKKTQYSSMLAYLRKEAILL
jgi:hypothetical protein